jgi:type II secretion system protein H
MGEKAGFTLLKDIFMRPRRSRSSSEVILAVKERGCMPGRNGFTIIEVIIVIAIMAMMAAFAVPSFQEFQAQRRLNGAARELHSNLMAMRMQAVSETQYIAASIDNDHQYTIFRDENKDGAMDSGESVAVKDLHPTYHDVTFSTSSGTVVTFYPTGRSSAVTLGVTGATGSKTITVSTAGRARIN